MIFNNYKPIRLIELFAGIGSQAKALTNLGLNFEHWRVCEFDEHAVRSYNAVHGTNFVTSEITKISAADLDITDTDEFTYLLTYSFPCQDLSNAGKGRGMEKGCGTRSGLLWEVERLLNECDELPQVLLMENVPQVHSGKNREHFDKWIEFLTSKGYSNYWNDINAKDHGVPQNRNRCFMVSILGDYSYEFPKPVPLEKRLRDVMEFNVADKYYIDNKYESILKVNDNYSLLCGGIIGKMHDISRRVYSSEYIAPSLHTCGGGNLEPKVFEPRVVGGIGKKKSNGGRQWYQQDRIYDDGIAISVTTAFNPYYVDTNDGRPRKLTPKECWRLMGFNDEDFFKAERVCSNTQLYKQAGNSIVVNVLMAIFRELFIPQKTRSEWLDDLLGGDS
jgi:DNA (cytosine-5)-methyltransferase 1